MPYEVAIKHKAWNDLARINEWYILHEGVEAAAKVCSGLKAALQRLDKLPRVGAPLPDDELNALGWRKLLHRQYAIMYKIDDRIVEIHRIIDTRREDPLALLRDGAED